MSNARKRRHSNAFARHMNRVSALNAHSVSWGVIHAMIGRKSDGWEYIRRQEKRDPRG